MDSFPRSPVGMPSTTLRVVCAVGRESLEKETTKAGKRKMSLEHEALTDLLNFAKTTREPKRVIAA